MQEDPVASLLASVEKDCSANNILICYGFIEENDLSPITNFEVDSNWDHFQKVLKALEAKVITVDIERNEHQDYDSLTEQINSLNDVAKEEAYSEALSIVKKNDGKIAAFTISFVHHLMNYQLKIKAEWYDQYDLLDGIYLEDDDEVDEKAESEGLSADQIEKIARAIAGSPEYARTKLPSERVRVCWAMDSVRNLESYSDRNKIYNRAETIFINEVFPVLDKEMGIKIQELKAQGLKKVHVKAKLGISENTLYRHWDP